MNMKNNLEVIIDKKRYTIGGYVSEDYLQKTATFINAKIAELQADESYRHLDKDLKAVLLNINLADEYFKLLEENHPFFSLQLHYVGEKLTEAVLDGEKISKQNFYC